MYAFSAWFIKLAQEYNFKNTREVKKGGNFGPKTANVWGRK